ncbi:MAG: hypothetical protein BWY77_00379 [bacterium ADurb.Bin431]|nr:MAG: hypothetical protein BWY77_00379 [bacterium ADurb.Bin431]
MALVDHLLAGEHDAEEHFGGFLGALEDMGAGRAFAGGDIVRRPAERGVELAGLEGLEDLGHLVEFDSLDVAHGHVGRFEDVEQEPLRRRARGVAHLAAGEIGDRFDRGGGENDVGALGFVREQKDARLEGEQFLEADGIGIDGEDSRINLAGLPGLEGIGDDVDDGELDVEPVLLFKARFGIGAHAVIEIGARRHARIGDEVDAQGILAAALGQKLPGGEANGADDEQADENL